MFLRYYVFNRNAKRPTAPPLFDKILLTSVYHRRIYERRLPLPNRNRNADFDVARRRTDRVAGQLKNRQTEIIQYPSKSL